MYCIKCGVKLDNSVTQCPLCQTKLQYPEPVEAPPAPAYPKERYPKVFTRPGAIKATLLVMFLIPLLVTFLVDLQSDGQITWFGYAAGGIILGFLVLVFPFWFRKPDYLLLIGCDFAAAILYQFYIDWITPGDWFFSFGLPVTVAVAIPVICTIILLRKFPKGRLYISGGAVVVTGLVSWLIELQLESAFGIPFFGWSYCILGSLTAIGGLIIYLAVNSRARENLERRIFM